MVGNQNIFQFHASENRDSNFFDLDIGTVLFI